MAIEDYVEGSPGSGSISCKPRSYQVEICMIKQKLAKRVAYPRTRVVLCHQQYEVFQDNLPAYQSRLLSGADNIDRWTDQRLWDAVLTNIRIVVSTPMVLLDALTHGFVQMERLALLVFDEAHHCTKNDPMNQIMQNFYRPELATSGTSTPHILGLSASPVVNAKAGGLQSIEQNLNARAVTPKTHRSEMRQHVSRPILERRLYPKTQTQIGDEGNSALQCLMDAYKGFDIMQDPYVTELQQSTDPGASDKLQKAVQWYLIHCIDRFNAKLEMAEDLLPEWTEKEKVFLCKHLEDVRAILPVCMSPLEPGLGTMLGMSPKVQTLVDLLVQEANPSFTGIIFVDQRATVAALAQVLSTHPETRDLFSIGTFVGMSSFSNRKVNIADVVEPQEQQQKLLDFRVGKKNLIIATSVLEEGIDVPACSITICFDEPRNLVSFIQRRGRARKQNSKYVVLIPDLDSTATPERWLSLEKDMKEAYEDETRKSQSMEMGRDTEEAGERTMRLRSTGQAGNYVNLQPEFSITEDETTHTVTAEIILPTLVDPSVRRACSLGPWRTERMARKDAAFQAFVALHRAGLVNDNLLPLLRQQEDIPAMNPKDGGPTRVSVAERVDPWILVAQEHRDPKLWFKTLITLKAKDEEITSMVMLLPYAIADQSDFTLYWNANVEYTVHTKLLDELESPSTNCEDIVAAKDITHLVLWSVYRSRMLENRRDYPALFVPYRPGVALRIWADQMRGSRPAEDIRSTGSSLHSPSLFPYMLRVLKEGVDCLHPKQRLGMLAGTKKIRYDVRGRKDDCWRRGESRYEVEVEAARQALFVLRETEGIKDGDVEMGEADAEDAVGREEIDNGRETDNDDSDNTTDREESGDVETT
ncbi:P-loop containing nucleoside triphosphate hydrolase protein [Cryomyces antarcticus]